MRKIIFTLIAFLFVMIGFAQGSETFDNATGTLPTGSTYGDGSFVGNGGVTWSYVHCQEVGNYPIDGSGILLRRANEPSSISATIQGGIGTFSVDTRKGYSSNAQRRLELVINDVVVQQFEPVYPSGETSEMVPFVVEDINIEGEFTLELRMYGTTGNQHIVLDNISWTGYTTEEPDPCDELAILTVEEGSVCDEGIITLGATAETENIYWYAEQTGGTPIGSGVLFTTPNLTETTSYWVSEYMLGEDTEVVTGLGQPYPTQNISATSNSGLFFTATEPFTLVSVEVFSNTAAGGLLEISLRDINNGNIIINTATITLPPGGSTATPIPVTVPLNFEVQPGSYRIIKETSVGMAYNLATSGGFSFPYPLGNVGTITGGATQTGTSTLYYYFYNWTIQIGSVACESDRVEVVATVNETIDIEVAVSEEEICLGENTTLSVTSTNEDYQYTWEPGGLTGDSVSVSPTENTSYTVTALDPNTGCGTEMTVFVIVNSVPEELMITASDTEVCIDTVVSLVASAVGAGDIEHDFELPVNEWTTDNNSTSGNWSLVTSPFQTSLAGTAGLLSSNDASQFYIFDANAMGSGSSVDAKLISPSFNLAGSTDASINFFHYYRLGSASTTSNFYTEARVEVSTDGGITYTLLQQYATVNQGTPTEFAEVTISLNDYLGENDVRVRFHYDGGWGYFWAIDNVTILGAATGTTTWSPMTNLYLDEEATIPYDGSEVSSVYMKSDQATEVTYTATLTVGTCGSISEDVMISVTAPDAPTADDEQIFCGTAMVEDLEVSGEDGAVINWYISETDDEALAPDTELSTGDYYVSQNIDGCESERVMVSVEVNPIPDAPMGDAEQTFTDGDTLDDLEVEADGELAWYDEQGNPLEDSTLLVDGTTYYVSQIVDGCQSELLAITVTEELSTKNNDIAGFSCYPNPVENVLFIKANNILDKVVVFNNLGQIVLQKEIKSTEGQVDFSMLPTGNYIAKVTSEGKVSVQHLIKK